jgi:hypothetical protein
MKTRFNLLLMLTLLIVQACSTRSATETASPQEPAIPPYTETSMPDLSQPLVETAKPEVIQSTAVILPALPTLTPFAEITETPIEDNSNSEIEITFDENGKIFNVKVGDSILLNLGTDLYAWTVNIDHENVLHLKMGVMVIQGAQGLYDAIAPGRAILSASGDPLCLNSHPACAMPSVFFSVTVNVK